MSTLKESATNEEMGTWVKIQNFQRKRYKWPINA
jgi:hypothetical protein